MMLQVLEEVLRRRGSEGWLVGGTVRDRRSGRLSPDLDVVVADDPAEVAEEVSGALRSPWFALSTRHGAYRVLAREGHIDVAGMRGAGILEDLALRDFTINAMAVPIIAGAGDEVLDPFGGREHLAESLLVAVSEHIFEDDPLRLMRAVRFSHRLGLRMGPALEGLLRSQAGELVRSAPERIVAELALTLDGGASAFAVRMLDDLGLMRAFLPEAVADDSCAALEALDVILADGSWPDRPWASLLRRRMTVPVDGALSRPAALRLATLLCLLSAGSVASIGRRLKLSGAVVDLIQAASGCHHRPGGAGTVPFNCLEAAVASPRASTTFFWDNAPWEPEVVLVAAADAAARVGWSGGGAAAVLGSAPPATVLLDRWAQRIAGLPDPPFDGTLLMEALGLTQGPALGEVLRETRLAWESGEIDNLDQALDVARAARASLLV